MGKSDVGEGKITSARLLGALGGSILPLSSLRSISPNKFQQKNSCFRLKSQRKLLLVQEERGALVEEKVGGVFCAPLGQDQV